jgi:hypothetical protein
MPRRNRWRKWSCVALDKRGRQPGPVTGHADLSMTQRDIHLGLAALDSAVSQLGELQGPAPSGRGVGEARPARQRVERSEQPSLIT